MFSKKKTLKKTKIYYLTVGAKQILAKKGFLKTNEPRDDIFKKTFNDFY